MFLRSDAALSRQATEKAAAGGPQNREVGEGKGLGNGAEAGVDLSSAVAGKRPVKRGGGSALLDSAVGLTTICTNWLK